MGLDRKVSAGVGVFLLGLAVFALLSPAFASLVPVGAALAILGNDYLLVAAVAVAVLACVVVLALARTVTGVTEATPPTVEEVAPAAPGRDVDEALAAASAVRVTDEHRRLHERVRTAAVATLAESERCSRREARERVDRGSWTGDPDAAAFVAAPDLRPPSLPARVLARLRGDHWFRRRVAATVRAIERTAEAER